MRALQPIAPFPRRRDGVVAAELILGIVVIALVLAVAAELLHRLQQERRRATMVEDLKTFATVFERYAAAQKTITVGNDDSLPAALQTALRETNWPRGSPFGGMYEWQPAPAKNAPAKPAVAAAPAGTPARSIPKANGAILVTAFAPSFPLTASRRDWEAIDAALDDGNLATGRFRTGFNGWPVYKIGNP